MRYLVISLVLLSACAPAPAVHSVALDATRPDDTIDVIVPPDRSPCVAPPDYAGGWLAQPAEKDGYVCTDDLSWCVFDVPAELIPVLDVGTPVCP